MRKDEDGNIWCTEEEQEILNEILNSCIKETKRFIEEKKKAALMARKQAAQKERARQIEWHLEQIKKLTRAEGGDAP